MSVLSDLLEKLRRVEALHSRTDVAGEKQAAAAAMEAIRRRLERMTAEENPIVFKFTMENSYSRALLVALFRRYGITPFRNPGQRRTTVMARVPQKFVDETLWPEFLELSETLQQHLQEVTDRLIREAIWADTSEVTVCEEPKRIGNA